MNQPLIDMNKYTSTKESSLAIARSGGYGTCKACRYSIGGRNPRGELFLIVDGGRSVHPRAYHFGCYSQAIEDYESGCALHAARNGKEGK